jgi:chemotaxis protein methyltransferase CheR
MLARDFETFSSLVKAETGLAISPDKAYLLEARLAPVALKWNFSTIEQLAEALRNRQNAAQVRDVAEAMTINESQFFRDAKPFDLLRDKILPALLAARAVKRRLRIWSAACSSGQEAYSIAILLQECGNLAGWTIDIVGTDISTEMVERARAGIYTSFEIQRGMPAKLLVKHFARVGEKWQIAESVRHTVQFKRQNLLHDLTPLGTYDIVFCRNVLIYFDLATKAKVLAALHRQMPEDGYLVLGAAETVIGVTNMFAQSPGLPGVYVPSNPNAGPAAASVNCQARARAFTITTLRESNM